MKLGVPWTSKGNNSPDRSAPYDDADAASIHGRLDDLTRQLERLSRITAGKVRPAGRPAETPIRDQPPPDDDLDPYDRVDQRIEQFASEARAGSGDVARYAGGRSLNRNPLQPIYSNTNRAYSGSSLDRTLAEIAARQRALDGEGFARRGTEVPRPIAPPAQNLSGLEEQLRKITSQIEALQRPSAMDDALPALREELSEIGRSLAEAMPRQAIEAIEGEIRSLAARLDQSRQSGVDDSALANLEHGLAEVRDALHSLKPAESLAGFQSAIQALSRKIDNITASQQDPAVLHQLEAAITGLRGIVAHVASDDTLSRLTEEVRGIAVRLERSAGSMATPESLTNLERQIGTIAEAIDQSNAQDRQVPAQLETMLQGLAERIEKLEPSRGDTIAFGQLEERIARLVEKLDASGSRFSQLEAIERGLADVLVHLEEQRARGGAVARAPGGDPAVEPLKRELDAVNGTLNRVIDRLATIETGIRAGDRSTPDPVSTAAAAQPVANPKPDPVPASAPPPKPPVAATIPARAPVLPASQPDAAKPAAHPVASPSQRLAAAAHAQRQPPRDRAPIDASLPPDHPLEPGAVHARTAQSPAARIAASEAALGPVKPPTTPDPAGRSNFLAAARRAAQTAMRSRTDTDNDGTASDNTASKVPLRQRLTGRVRSMLVAAGVVVLVVGALRLGMTLIEAPAPDGPSIQESTEAPEPQGPTKLSAGIGTDPLAIASAREAGGTPSDDADRPASGPQPGDSEVGADQDAAPQTTPAPQRPGDVTGSIPSAAAAMPLPPTRPGGGSKANPNARLLAAATAGNPAAAYELAVRHLDGRGVRRSYEDAAHWLRRASQQRIAPAQFRLGSLYEKGLGVKKDLNEARRLYGAAAEQGNAKAMHNLAVLYAEGIDGKPNYKTAIQWFRKAADHGIADSQYNLGVLAARGAGIEQNLAESYKWFALAAKQGDAEAARKRDDIAGRLDAESLIAARLAVRTWTMLPQPEEATTVKSPPGGWDAKAQPASAKRGPRTGGPLKLGPG